MASNQQKSETILAQENPSYHQLKTYINTYKDKQKLL